LSESGSEAFTNEICIGKRNTGSKTDGLYVFITGKVVRRKYVEPYGTSCIVLLSPVV
jgi:hypothetical protein